MTAKLTARGVAFLTLSEVADQLNVSVRSVRRMINRGLKVYHLGPRTIRIHQDDINRYLWACAAKADSGGSRSKSRAGDLAQRLGPQKKRGESKPKSAEIMPFPERVSRPVAA
jgi:excisionase family DNA binding protein